MPPKDAKGGKGAKGKGDKVRARGLAAADAVGLSRVDGGVFARDCRAARPPFARA